MNYALDEARTGLNARTATLGASADIESSAVGAQICLNCVGRGSPHAGKAR
jgi:hypothetical protein